jgi:hypothetical protein
LQLTSQSEAMPTFWSNEGSRVHWAWTSSPAVHLAPATHNSQLPCPTGCHSQLYWHSSHFDHASILQNPVVALQPCLFIRHDHEFEGVQAFSDRHRSAAKFGPELSLTDTGDLHSRCTTYQTASCTLPLVRRLSNHLSHSPRNREMIRQGPCSAASSAQTPFNNLFHRTAHRGLESQVLGWIPSRLCSLVALNNGV